VYLQVEQTETAFTNAYEPGALLRMPVAHGDGRFAADADTVRQLEADRRVVVRYASLAGPARGEDNPNGSVNDIAGICNAQGNIVGLMPHPDRAADPALGNLDGMGFFQSVLTWLSPTGASR
jgi:phosphoribosylformylglycinamidine synthase